MLLDACSDELEVLVANEVGEGSVVERIRKRIDEVFRPKEDLPKEIVPAPFIKDTLEKIRPRFRHRDIELNTYLETTRPISIPEDPLEKLVIGLVKNAIENTPDEGKIEITCREKGNGVELIVRDYGVGITLENRRRIFEGFFVTQETMDYSTKREFDFNAGGKGADLLRMKIFSERYHFKIDMASVRCRYIPTDKDICPGRISKCGFCRSTGDCHESGGTTFTVFFPFESAAAHQGSPPEEAY
ncbi:MAG TPA: sensor histidine kinase [Desulfobacteraceae bacterium]|nr:sensor histidine kinase [Desulfobacteraceae bacterium]